MNKYLKFEYWNTCDLGNIYYQGGQHFIFYLDADVGEPIHEDVEEGQENGDGDFIPTYRRQMKRYRIRTGLVPDYLIDAIQRMKLHDNIELTFKSGEVEQIYNVDVEAEWQFERYAWQGTLTITFDMDETITIGACCDNLVVGEPIPEFYWVAETGSDASGDGSYNNPWAHVSYACTQVSSGDTVYVKAGTINESAQIVKPVGVSIIGQGQGVTIIKSTFNHGSALQAAIQCASTAGTSVDDNSSISHITLDGSNWTGDRAIYIGYRNNITIHDCTIVNFAESAILYYGSATSYPNLYLTGHKVYDCTITDCAAGTSGYDGSFRIIGVDGLEIYNCKLNNTGRAAGSNLHQFAPRRCRRLNIHHNELWKNNSEITSDGSYVWNFFLEEWDYKGGSQYHHNVHHGLAKWSIGGEFNEMTDGTTFGYKVYNNTFLNSNNGNRNVNGNEETLNCLTVEGDQHREVYIYNNYIERYAIGVALSTPSSGTGYWHHNWEWDGIYVHNNVIVKCGYADFQYGAIGIWWVNETDDPEYTATYENIGIYNNTITGTNEGSYRGYHGIGVFANGIVNNVNIRNNIIYDFQWYGIMFSEHLNDSLVLTNLNITHNNIYDCYNSNAIYLEPEGAGRDYTNIDITTGHITSNPLFVSATDLRLQSGSPCINAGIDVGLLSDYIGNPIIGLPDIGAYEYVP